MGKIMAKVINLLKQSKAQRGAYTLRDKSILFSKGVDEIRKRYPNDIKTQAREVNKLSKKVEQL